MTSGASVASSHQRLAFPDGMRALAALYVVLGHSLLQIWPAANMDILARPWTAWMQYAHYAVTVFIVISGFCLALPVVRGDGRIRGGFRTFIRRRARRLIIPYYLALLFSTVLIWLWIGKPTGTHWDLSIWVTWKGIITHVFLINNMWDPAMFNHALWSVATEWQIYFFFPLLVYGFRKIGPERMTLLTIIASYAILFLSEGTRIYRAQPHYLGMFALGMLTASLLFSQDARLQTIRRRIPWSGISALMFFLLCVLFSHIDLLIVNRYEKELDLYIGLWTIVTIFAAAKPGWIKTFLEHPVLVHIGLFSYSIYLVHAPLLQVVTQYVVRPLGYSQGAGMAMQLAFGVPFVLAIAYAFFRVCERPFWNAPHTSQAS